MKQTIVLFTIALLMVSCGSTKLSKEEKAQKRESVSNILDSKEYSIIVEQMLPMRGKTVHLTAGYSLRILRDKAYAYLPFFGRVTHAPYGGDGGIKFEEAIRDYVIAPNSKGDGWDVSFKVNTSDLYQYQFNINIFDNGKVSMGVTSPQRDYVNFYGYIE